MEINPGRETRACFQSGQVGDAWGKECYCTSHTKATPTALNVCLALGIQAVWAHYEELEKAGKSKTEVIPVSVTQW